MNDAASPADGTRVGLEDIVKMAVCIGAGAIDVVPISTKDILVEEDLANMCRQPLCAFYGLSANCPPNVIGPAGFRELLKTCKYALAIKMEVPMGCLITDERVGIMKLLHEIVANIEKALVQLGDANSKGFAAGSCKELFCNEHIGCCVLTEGGECRHQQYARPSIEANGVNVNEMNKIAGWSVQRNNIAADPDMVSMGAVYGLVLIG